ncbi:UNVERIFIED_CONTAM: hypothetical protein Sradi_1774100 [Sesamum radiatum]|uniref:DUF4283 domain-containing protein n=1 Tax=Sesamum radiatum TaxID=300843 RepID=A0AAW2TVV6_SESRA
MGYFLGKRPYFHHVNEYVRSVRPMVREVKATTNGFFYFEFKTVAAMEEVIEGGPWLFHGQAIVLQKWEPGMVLRKLQHTWVPVWIKLRHLLVELWTNEGLSTVASGIGMPLYPDAITRACTRLDFARVCIMLDIGSKLPKHIVIMVPHEDGSESACKVDVEYEWLPPKCTACMSLGHSRKECTAMKPRQPPVTVYVQKLRVCPTGVERESDIPTASTTYDRSIGSSRDSEERADKSKAIVLYDAFEVLMEPDCAISKGQAALSHSLMINAAIWNVRGLNRRDHQVSVANLISEYRLQFIGLLEMRVSFGNIARMQRGLLPWWNWYVDYAGSGNRIWLAWNDDFIGLDVLETVRMCRGWWVGILIRWWMLVSWPNSFYVSLNARTFDHSPLVLRGDNPGQSASMFQFDNYLALSAEFIPSVRRFWQHRIVGTTMFVVTRKLKALKPIFRAQRQKKGDLSNNVKLAVGFLAMAQSLLAQDRHNQLLLHLEFCCKLVLRLALRLEQHMLQQRAKIAWMKDGD